MQTRFAFLTALAAPIVVQTRAASQPMTTIRLGSAPNDDLIAALWAIENGAFRRAGIDVVLQMANSGAAVAAAVAGNGVEIGHANLVSWITGRMRGLPFVLIAPAGIYSADALTVGMIVAKDSPIKSAADCNGKSVGVSGLNDLAELGTRSWVDRNGGDAKTLRFLEIPTSAIGDAVASGRVDAGTVSSPSITRALAGGKVRLLAAPDSAIASRFLESAYVGTADYVARNRAAITAFRRIINEAGAYANDHRSQMLPIITKYIGVDPKVLAAEPQQLVGTSLDLRIIQPLIKAAVTYGVIPSSFDVVTMIDHD
jgi:NitT/TauT family transport system substrate-binding protein